MQMTVASGITAYEAVYYDAGVNPFQLITRGQLCILVNGTINPFSQLKVEVNASGVGTSYVTIYDPTNAIYQPPAVVTSVDSAQLNTYIVAYQIPLAALSGGLSGFGRIRFTWTGGTGPLGTVTLCSMWSTISNAQANAVYAVSYYNSASRSESPGVIVNQTSGNTLYNLIYGYNAIAGSSTTSGLLPLSQLLYYQTAVYANVFTITGTTASGTNQGVNLMNVYRQQVGEVQYSYIGVSLCATYNAGINSWQISPAGSQTIVFSDGGTNNSVTENAARVYPNAYTICLPKGYVMTYSGSRLYVGGNSQVFVSDYLQPFRFRGQVTFLNSTTADPSSGTLNTFPGEQVTALIKASGSYIGVDTILAFTNKSMYRLDGQNAQTLSRPTREVEKGTLQPWSVVSYRGLVYWIDQDRIVQEWNGASPTPISRYKIDDKLWNGNLSLTSMAVQNERLYLAYQPSGGSAQTNVLVYEESLKEWCEDVMTGAVTIGQLLTIDDLSFRKVYFLDNGGHLYQYEQLGATQDYGNPITVSFTTRRFQSDGWNYLDSQRVGVVCDGQGSGSLTVARSAFGAALGFNTNGTINITYPASIVYAYEHTSSGVLPGGTSQGLQLTISGSVSGSWNLYYAGVNLSPNATSGAVDGS
jgi:hypothetical protein